MARIVDANKAESLRSITVEEYGTKVSLQRQANGTGIIGFTVADPRRAERASLRDFIGSIDTSDETPVLTILAELDKRDEEATSKWGERLPIDFSTTIWLEAPVALAIANLFGENDLDTTTRQTIREALDTTTPTKANQF